MRAAGSLDGDFRFAEGADFGSGSRGDFLFFFKMELIHGLDDQKEDQSHQQEVDHSSDKGAVGEHSGIFSFSNGDGKGGKIHAAGDNADQRVENVVNQRVYDGGKRAADDDADGHVYHVATRDKLFEFFDDFHEEILLK